MWESHIIKVTSEKGENRNNIAVRVTAVCTVQRASGWWDDVGHCDEVRLSVGVGKRLFLRHSICIRFHLVTVL